MVIMSWTRLAGLSILLGAGCNLILGNEPGVEGKAASDGGENTTATSGTAGGQGGGGMGGATASSSSGTGGAGGELCGDASDCTPPVNPCLTSICIGGHCGTGSVPAGPAGAQTAADCKEVDCDGSGTASTVNDDLDVVVDGMQCTDDLCTNGVPSNPTSAAGQVCSEDGGKVCNDQGACVDCADPNACTGKCGTLADACNVQVSCGVCVSPAVCGVVNQGMPNVCGVPSCVGGGTGAGTDCGPNANADCCASPVVTGGTFSRSYDNVTYTDASFAATVSDFRLDSYEITVGRFRKFVAAVVGNWLPASGSGKHTHLNGGGGLNAGTEPGWDPSWNTNLPNVKATWDGSSQLACSSTYQTWTSNAGGNEKRPINCVNWYQAYAFCIWDGGFLPSEAEWNYAASGGGVAGDGQRVYPWSSPPTSTTIDPTYASYYSTDCLGDGVAGCTLTDLIFVGTKPAGNGKWGQADLAGNVYEWDLDWYASPYPQPCNNCANTTSASARVVRGGYFGGASDALASYRGNVDPAGRGDYIGARCSRTP